MTICPTRRFRFIRTVDFLSFLKGLGCFSLTVAYKDTHGYSILRWPFLSFPIQLYILPEIMSDNDTSLPERPKKQQFPDRANDVSTVRCSCSF